MHGPSPGPPRKILVLSLSEAAGWFCRVERAMQWQDEGFVLATRRYGEGGLIVQLLTREHGRHAGLVRGGQGPRLRTVFQIGNRIDARWNARLAEHLGAITGELRRGPAARFIDDPVRLACLAAAAAMAESALPEREPHPRAFDGFGLLVASLEADHGWAVGYIEWEMVLLAELGFGLDLSRCAATGETADLVYVSPKSGHAVSRRAGEPYRDKLLPLPAFLLPQAAPGRPAAADVLDGLALTGFFLERRVFEPHGREMPPARARFVDLVRRMTNISSDC
jgi:DNA repair protein RecO (recombination protein O)